jgi:uncharacterized membrane protein
LPRRPVDQTLVRVRQLVVIAYTDEYRAAEVLATLQRLHLGSELPLTDAVCLVRATDWTVKLHQSIDLAARDERATGVWRRLAANLVTAPGIFDCRARAGDFGLTDSFKRELGAELPPGSSAVLLLVPPPLLNRYVADLHRFGGKLLHTPIAMCALGAEDAAEP